MNSQSSYAAFDVKHKTQPRLSFGFLDGVSEPAVKGFDDWNPESLYPNAVDPGIIVTGYEGDPELKTCKREPWAFDGSFLVFRWLSQQVPEFNNYLKRCALHRDGEGNELTPEKGRDLLGARMVGRWKSGAPIVQTPWKDDSNMSQ
jgi:deferrochelatase/peroxidase EfeB